MRKAFKFEGLCCANCARKIEEGINKIEGVTSAKVVFMTEKLILEIEGEDFDPILDEAQAVCTRYEEDCIILR